MPRHGAVLSMTDSLSVICKERLFGMKFESITDGELSILQVIWDQTEPTSRDITAALYDEVTDSKLASAQKLLERLEAKGFVERDRSERAHRFHALVTHEEFLRSQLNAVADRLCDGALAPLVTTLLKSKGMSRKNREQLRTLIDELWPPK
jgi:BlaI family transcriptional regulator, penicillinase repressor